MTTEDDRWWRFLLWHFAAGWPLTRGETAPSWHPLLDRAIDEGRAAENHGVLTPLPHPLAIESCTYADAIDLQVATRVVVQALMDEGTVPTASWGARADAADLDREHVAGALILLSGDGLVDYGPDITRVLVVAPTPAPAPAPVPVPKPAPAPVPVAKPAPRPTPPPRRSALDFDPPIDYALERTVPEPAPVPTDLMPVVDEFRTLLQRSVTAAESAAGISPAPTAAEGVSALTDCLQRIAVVLHIHQPRPLSASELTAGHLSKPQRQVLAAALRAGVSSGAFVSTTRDVRRGSRFMLQDPRPLGRTWESLAAEAARLRVRPR